jgi:glycosyltransferase involved in cell wall biosynthesis
MHKLAVLVVPCFNEENRFPVNYWQEILNANSDISWIFVNDGSTDKTIELLKEITRGTESKYISCNSNLGKGNAIRIGFLNALKSNLQYQIFGYVDSDGAFSREDIFRMVEQASEKCVESQKFPIDVLLSSRVGLAGHQINRRRSRHYLGRMIATFLTNGWKDAPYDTQSGFKLFRNSIPFQQALNEEFKTKWFVDVELFTRIGINKGGDLNLWEEPVTSWRDVEGSKISLRKILRITVEIILARREIRKLIEESRF